MDFFGRQAETRRLSRWLVLLFILAVGAIVVAIDLVVVVAVSILASQDGGMLAAETVRFDDYPLVIGVTTVVVLGTIFISSLVRTASLSAGGGSVAQSLGGTRITGDSGDPLRRRLMNVVEEMAIASGVPVPQVYVLEREAGINAFAAGHNPANAAVAVTRGALVNLNRSELQGVIAHEFAHVLNGDMRLSTRLIGWLFGLTVIAMVARLVLRHAPRGARGSRKGGGAIAVIIAAAAIVLVLGWIGLFFGRLIQAAVSRKRESLADASAIQFTREREGLRGALVKIGALGVGSRFTDTDAEEVAHLLFASGVQRAFATHPPLVERIREIDPGFDPREFEVMRQRMNEERAAAIGGNEARPGPAAKLGGLLEGALVLAPATVAALVANPGTEHVLQAQGVLSSLPPGMRLVARDPERAAALFLALALDPTAEGRGRQLPFIHRELGGEFHDAVVELLPQLDPLTAVQRMPALLQVFAALHQVPRTERVALLKCLNGLLTREGRVSVFAYAMRKLSQVQLQDELDPRRRIAGSLTLAQARDGLQILFSVLAMHGSEDDVEARRAYEIGMEELLPTVRPPFKREGHWPPRLDQALTQLDALQPAAKEMLVKALVRTLSHDQRMTVAESELLRAICAALHCPLPPLYAAT
ncbi:MAG: M48 family metallopeptidase [Gammaproteobacteria bacterium]